MTEASHTTNPPEQAFVDALLVQAQLSQEKAERETRTLEEVLSDMEDAVRGVRRLVKAADRLLWDAINDDMDIDEKLCVIAEVMQTILRSVDDVGDQREHAWRMSRRSGGGDERN